MVSEVPTAIKTALAKAQERLYLLYLEKELINFITGVSLGTTHDLQYVIKVHYLKNSYYRLLSHQLCQYYNLQHQNNQFNEILVTIVDNFDYQEFMDKKVVRISEIAKKYQQAEPADHFDKPKVMIKDYPKRILKSKVTSSDENSIVSEDNGDDNIESERASKEALYLKIRQQIFDAEQQEQDDAEDDDSDDNDNDDQYNEFSYDEDNETDDTIPDMSLPYGIYLNGAYPPIPMGYPPMSPSQQFRGYPPNYYPQYTTPIQNTWFPPMYDKETERRLLNNPYIIIPENRDDYKKNANSNYKKNYKYNPNVHPNGYPNGYPSRRTNVNNGTQKTPPQ